MKKIVFSITFILFTLCAFSISSYAAPNKDSVKDMSNNVKNVIGGAENTVENAVKDTSNSIKSTTNLIEESGKNITENAKNTANNIGKDADYTAKRTATGTTNAGNTLGVETWSWVIVAIVAIAIIALFWYFVSHSKNNDRHE